ncbi:hypothetical protein Dpep_1885 [Dethiosulfovibrio peptidovorans DSM 11002]|uniref:Uncharacterized protein n=1 Tax=Dethiosulfovibrio peptidovorans DSM 11002 TaxID=469381 RepID=D2Z8W2_9BACT|nr:hypothetical protein [Dethiosulfovibrio peptidovorans]EFC91909.1 hypothetical protein Dpep_1885 [Dethiosulfovibrio peptidovorans DSM 11002]
MQDRSIRLEDHFLDVLSVEIANYERISHLLDDMEEARLVIDPVVVDIRKLTSSYIRRNRVPSGGGTPFVVYCRIRGGGAAKEALVEDSISRWYGEEIILRATKKIVDRGFFSRYQVEDAVGRIGSMGWVPADSDEDGRR